MEESVVRMMDYVEDPFIRSAASVANLQTDERCRDCALWYSVCTSVRAFPATSARGGKSEWTRLCVGKRAETDPVTQLWLRKKVTPTDVSRMFSFPCHCPLGQRARLSESPG